MTEQRYDPRIYGALKAQFLENLADDIPGFYTGDKHDRDR